MFETPRQRIFFVVDESILYLGCMPITVRLFFSTGQTEPCRASPARSQKVPGAIRRAVILPSSPCVPPDAVHRERSRQPPPPRGLESQTRDVPREWHGGDGQWKTDLYRAGAPCWLGSDISQCGKRGNGVRTSATNAVYVRAEERSALWW